LRICRAVWWVGIFLPPAIYYATDETPAFPAMISWVGRKGMPQLATQAFWLAGWLPFYLVVRRRGDALLRALMWFWLAEGVIGIILYPAGSGNGRQDMIHTVSSGLYMANHHLFFKILGVGTGSILAFWICLVTFLGTNAFVAKLENDESSRESLGCRADCLWYAELVRMLTENGLFMIFFARFLSGVKRRMDRKAREEQEFEPSMENNVIELGKVI